MSRSNRKVQVGECYKLAERNTKGRNIIIDEVNDDHAFYTYVETNMRGSAALYNQFIKSASLIDSLDDDKLSLDENFYVCWVEGSHKPVTRKFSDIEKAQSCAEYLLGKNADKVHILQHIGTAVVPRNVAYNFTKSSGMLQIES